MSILSSFVESFVFQCNNRSYWIPQHFGLTGEYFFAEDARAKKRISAGIIKHPDAEHIKGTVLYFYAGVCNWQYNLPQVLFLLFSGYQVVVFDYAGAGASEGSLTIDGMSEDAQAVFNHLKSTHKIEGKIAVFAQGIGCDAAIRFCSENADEGCETPVVKAPREKNIIPGSFATPEAIAHIMTQKFVMGSPLYRQEQEINRQGIQLSRQTMSNWILKVTEDYLTPVYKQLHKELLKRDVLHGDETTLQVLHEPGKAPQSESYMWLYRTSGDTGKPIVLYEYQPGRGAKHPKEFLAGYKGYLHTDGYQGYHSLPEDITVVGCWAHARRKFDEAVKSLPKGKAKGSSASQGLAYCNLLFEIEQGLAEKTAKERYNERLKQAKPVLDAMFAWANSKTAAPKSALGKAFTYLNEQWPYLTNYLKDGRLELSNNRAERSIKPFVIDRKNFLFANTPKGAKGSAIMFSLIQTAIENGLDPYQYLTWLLKNTNKADLKNPDMPEKLLPWNAPAGCRTK